MIRTKPSFLFILRERLRGRSFLYEFYFKGKKSLDIGCGEGEFMRNDPRGITGVDPNERTVVALRKRGFEASVGQAGALPFPDAAFERVHCRNVIEHLSVGDAYALITEAARVLSPGGLFILASEVPTSKFWSTFGHIKPYPPEAVIKLLRHESREEFEGIDTLEYVDTFYFGEFFRNKIAYLLSVFVAYYTPLLRREYFLVLRKK